MSRRFLRTALFGIALLYAVHPAAVYCQNVEPRIQVHTAPNPVSEGESVNFRISVELDSTAQISEPSYSAPDFEMVGQSNSIDIVTIMENGRFIPRRKNSYTYILLPRKAGLLSIGNISVQVAGKKFTAEDVKVKVEKGDPSARPRTGIIGAAPKNEEEDEALRNVPDEDPARFRPTRPGQADAGTFNLNSDFTVRLHLSKRKAYAGEPIVAEYYLYDFGNLTRVDIKKWPTFNGFWKEDLEIPTRFDFQDEFASGRRVRRALLGRFALFPVKPGKLEISKLIVNGTFIANAERARPNDPFSTFFGLRTVRQASHSSQEEVIQVEPLPEQGKPADFNGAVGSFEIQLQPGRTSSRVNEPVTLKFAVKGTGNFHALEAPEFKFPDGLEVYETSANVQASAARGVSVDLEKSVSFDILIVPRREGKFSVPAFDWSYFDVAAGAYKTLTTQPFELEALPAAPGSVPAAPAGTTAPVTAPSKPEVKEEIRYLKEIAGHGSSLQNPLRLLVYALALINLALLVLLIAVNFKRIRHSLQRSESRDRTLRLALGGIDKRIKAKASDYEALETAVLAVFEALLNTDARGMTSAELAKACADKGVSAEHTSRLLELQQFCHAQRFAARGEAEFRAFAAHGRALQKLVDELDL